ncbi:hypothetical protein [Noviherbaspirillum massiliense]|uniref:hypothetical protein n=1 Tax=Noviherbaspirillum massiliense TaxID=1465823 RepID=UPI0002D5C717|nr:hypothetical protein [Noviherbaspirillum massiliense]
MSTTSLVTYPQQAANGSYLPNVGRATLNLLAALFAVPATEPAKAVTSKRVKDMSIWELYRLTVGYDSVSPKVAARLRAALVEG